MDQENARRRRLPVRRLFLAMFALLAVVFALLWWQRAEIATGLVDRELARRGVAARYRVTGIGFTTQRLEDVSIGDPRDPDLVARVVEIGLSIGLEGPVLTRLAAQGVRARGRIENGRLRLGAVDRLLPPPSGRPITLPDITVALDDARMRLDTPVGAATLRIDGRGNLADGFSGRLLAQAPRLEQSGCRVEGLVGAVGLTVTDRAPAVQGPLRLRAIRCESGGLAVESATLALDAALSPAFDRWQGFGDFDAAGLTRGGVGLGPSRGRVTFSGDADGTLGRIEAVGGGLRVAGVRGERVTFDADYAIGARSTLEGDVRLIGGSAPRERLAAVDRAASATAGTPLQPILDRIARAGGDAVRSFSAEARVSVLLRGGAGAVRLSTLDARSANGARLTIGAGRGVATSWPGGRRLVDADIALSGGGLPEISGQLRQARADAPVTGALRVAPYVAGDARIAFAALRFTAAGGATRFDTAAAMTGPLAGGRIEALRVPLSGRVGADGVTLDRGCLPVRFDRLTIDTLTLSPTALSLCPDGAPQLVTRSRLAAARIADPVLTGTIGDSPLDVRAASARIVAIERRFALADVVTLLGAQPRQTRLAAQAIEGRFVGSGAEGTFSGGGARIGAVPLVVGEADGGWRFADGSLLLDGAIGLTDAVAPARFEPLVATDASFRLEGGRIVAAAALTTPAGVAVTDVAIEHLLGPGRGAAKLSVSGIRFGDSLQPEMLTRLTVGVVADVVGTVAGTGEIGWAGSEVTSTGTFTTTDMALAAAFGPVEGLTTTVSFTDLIGLVTAPGQVATVRSVNPGIDIRDGLVRYALLAERRVAVEGGTWPLEGGTLTLEPTVLDFAEAAERRMVFRVDALDAGRFISRFDFDSLAATGVFDGELPILFDKDGGRIAGGNLVSRTQGGTIAYNGALNREDLGTYGRLAFDALRSLRYDRLSIDLDGSLDGEMVTQVRFAGVNRATPETRASMILSQFTNLPFIFNIRIRAPFRGLLASLRSLSDAEVLVREQLPAALGERTSVQTPASDRRR